MIIRIPEKLQGFHYRSRGKGVDIYYGELTELFGEGYFPSEITNPADQLQHISHVMDGMNAIYGNPFSGQAFDEVTAIVASDMPR